LNSIGIILEKQGNYAKAIEYYTQGLKLEEESENLPGIASSLINIGNIYDNQHSYKKALEYYTKSLEIEDELNNKAGIAKCLFNIGDTYADMGDFNKALEYHERSLKIKMELDDKSGIANSISLIGNIYLNQGDYKKAIEYNNKSLKISREIGYKSGIVHALQSLGQCYFEQGEFSKAINLSQQSLILARDIGIANETKKVAYTLYESYKHNARYRDALEMHELYILTRDSLESQENQKEVIKQEYKYAYEKQALADSIKNAEKQKVRDAELTAQKAISKQRKQQSYFLYGGLLIAVLFGAFIFNRLKLTRKQKGIIEDQKEQVDAAFNTLEEKNIQITDSINYARRIQSAILPPDKLVKTYLNQSFILYKPKDIVAGDFYWMEPLGENVLFAAADCTGHGVPGAMVSVVCNNSLNRAVREYKENDPGKILDKTRELVIQEFEKSEEEVQDGMDIALCSLQGNKLSYAGANNPLWIIRKDAQEIEIYKANKQPIGKYDKVFPYVTHHLELNSGDTFYVFSDGFADQFGGAKGKKLKAANFKKLLLSIQDKPMEEQHSLLDQYFNEWKGSLDQLDDVCVIGVRV
jgi:serine phosphatase RsbU (regulator of sigma subunit)